MVRSKQLVRPVNDMPFFTGSQDNPVTLKVPYIDEGNAVALDTTVNAGTIGAYGISSVPPPPIAGANNFYVSVLQYLSCLLWAELGQNPPTGLPGTQMVDPDGINVVFNSVSA